MEGGSGSCNYKHQDLRNDNGAIAPPTHLNQHNLMHLLQLKSNLDLLHLMHLTSPMHLQQLAELPGVEVQTSARGPVESTFSVLTAAELLGNTSAVRTQAVAIRQLG